MDFLLDPFVVAIPESIASSHDLSQYVQSLARWMSVARTTVHKFWFTTFLAIALTEEEKYPYPSNLKRHSHIALGADDTVNLQTALRMIQTTLMNPPYLDEKMGELHIEYALVDSVVLPVEIEARLSPNIALALKKSLVMMATAAGDDELSIAREILFATNPLPLPAGEVELAMRVLQQNDIWEQKNAAWGLIADPKQLDEIEGLVNFWDDTQRALGCSFDRLQTCGAVRGEQLPQSVVGPYFVESVRAFHPETNPALLDTIFRNTILALLGKGGFERHSYPRDRDGRINKHHPLRDNPHHQKERKDGATAWRVHLSSSYRLHYWLLPDGRAELARIVIHEDYAI